MALLADLLEKQRQVLMPSTVQSRDGNGAGRRQIEASVVLAMLFFS
jgi:hypothetical protein